MKKFCILTVLITLAVTTRAQVYYYICKDTTYQRVEINDRLELPTQWDDIDSITFAVPQFPVTPIETDGDTVTIKWSASGTEVGIPVQYKDCITITAQSGAVVVNNTNTDSEIVFRLSGSGTGSLTYYGSYKTTLVLDGLNLVSASGAAMNIQCGKRIAIELAEGTENTLTDAAGGGQKACLYVKGHTEFSKGGTLTINGNEKHGIGSKEYVLVKKTIGKITVKSAPGDGIHAGQYFKMNGGEVAIENGVLGDGIQAEATDDETDEQNGQMMLNGGVLSIDIKGDYMKCLKCDSLMTISDGEFTLKTSGASGVKPEEEDDPIPTPEGPSYKLYVSVSTKTGSGGGGGGFPGGGGQTTSYYWNQDHVYLYTSTGTLVATLNKKYTVSTGSVSRTFFVYDFGKAASGTTYYFKSDDYAGGGGGRTSYTIKSSNFTPTLDGTSDLFYVITDNYSSSGSTRTFTIGNQTSTYSGGTITEGGTSSEGDITYATCIKAENYLQEGGTITGTATGTAGRGISVDGDMTVNGGTNTFTCSGAGVAIGTSDNYSARGYKCDGNMYLYGGRHTIKMTGKGGKGIKVDGKMVVGDSDTEDMALTVTTSGSYIGTTGGGMEGGFNGSTKAIKVMGSYTQNGGDVYVTTTTNGAEGIESKSTMDFNGGTVYAKCYDDCINSADKMTFNGSLVYCLGTGNDAIDCNYNTTGGITIQGGAVVAFSTKGDPEEGIDIDNMSNLVVKGGYMFCGGGRQSSVSSLSSSSTQSYGIYSSTVSLTSGRYYTLLNNSSEVQLTVKMPATVSSKLTILTGKGMTKSATNYVKYSTAAPTGASEQFGDYIYIGGTTGTLTNAFSVTGK